MINFGFYNSLTELSYTKNKDNKIINTLYDQVTEKIKQYNLTLGDKIVVLKKTTKGTYDNYYFQLNSFNNVFIDRGFSLDKCNKYEFENCILSGTFRTSASVKNSIIRCGGNTLNNIKVAESFIANASASNCYIENSLICNSRIDEVRLTGSILFNTELLINCIGEQEYNNVYYIKDKVIPLNNALVLSLNLCGFQASPALDKFDKLLKGLSDHPLLRCYQEAQLGDYSLAFGKAKDITFCNRQNPLTCTVTIEDKHSINVTNIHAKAIDTNSTSYICKILHKGYITSKLASSDYLAIIGDFNNNNKLKELNKLHSNINIIKHRKDTARDNCMIFGNNSKYQFELDYLQIPTLDMANHKMIILQVYKDNLNK